MLILPRCSGQKIVINHDIMIEILETRKNRAVLAVDAPPHIPICRDEIYHHYKSKRPLSLTQEREALERFRQFLQSEHALEPFLRTHYCALFQKTMAAVHKDRVTQTE